MTSLSEGAAFEKAQSADLRIVKTGHPQTAAPGAMLDYRLTITNLGPDPAEGVQFTDIVPEGFLDARISEDGVIFNPWFGVGVIGTMEPDQSRTFTIRGTVSADAVQPLVNTASVMSATPDPNPENNRDTLVTGIISGRAGALTDMLASLALVETALAHILNAEGEKLQRILEMPDMTGEQLLAVNAGVTRTINEIVRLETVVQAKLGAVTE